MNALGRPAREGDEIFAAAVDQQGAIPIIPLLDTLSDAVPSTAPRSKRIEPATAGFVVWSASRRADAESPPRGTGARALRGASKAL